MQIAQRWCQSSTDFKQIRIIITHKECGCLGACIDRYDRVHTLFYLDPPYWETEGYGVPFS